MVVAFRRHTLLPLDDCLYALQPTIPHLTRSSLHRCLKRHGISRLPQVEGEASPKRKFKAYPIGFFHVDIAEVQTRKASSISCRDRPPIQVRGRPVRRQGQYADRARLPGGPCRRRALKDRDRAHRQWHPVRRPAEEPIRSDRQAPRPPFRSRLSGTRDRTSTGQAEISLDD